MIVHVTTASGARYTFNRRDLSWTRYHHSIDIHNFPSNSGDGVTKGMLVEWPAIIVGNRMMFDDTAVGTVYTTQIISAYMNLN